MLETDAATTSAIGAILIQPSGLQDMARLDFPLRRWVQMNVVTISTICNYWRSYRLLRIGRTIY